MRKSILPRQLLSSVLVASLGLVLFAATAQAEAKTWSLAGEFPLTKQNPAPDKYGNQSVWWYTHGLAGGTVFHKYARLFGPGEVEAVCGPALGGVYAWGGKKGVEGTPGLWYNAGPMVEEGQDLCAPWVTLSAKTVFMHPAVANRRAKRFVDSVARWKSPITGTVTVSGSIEPVDSRVSNSGISWQFDKGQAMLASGASAEDNMTSFGPIEVPVIQNEYLNLEVGRAVGVFGNNDSTAVVLAISSH
jgi:hypothetical protein